MYVVVIDVQRPTSMHMRDCKDETLCLITKSQHMSATLVHSYVWYQLLTSMPHSPSHTGAKKLLPQAWRTYPLFDNIYKLVGVPVITVQLRYDGWVTEMKDQARVGGACGGL
jgi:uncharacterized protein with NAD-binding domain and iron-sulfur cluster